jgi:hypothetical protein
MRDLWTAVWDTPRPHVHPLRTPAGRTLTTDAPPDHPWHHGLWSTIKFVNGENYWEEYGEFGVLLTRDVHVEGETTTAAIEWFAPDGHAIALRETRTLRHIELDAVSYAIDWTFALEPTVDTELDRTPFTTWGGYGGLTLRGAPDWSDTTLLVGNTAPIERTLGTRAPWCALTSRAATVAIGDHPDNAGYPTPWYASTRADTYGAGWANFLNAAFLWDGPLSVAAGSTFTRRHLVIVADGALDAAAIEAHHATWTGR